MIRMKWDRMGHQGATRMEAMGGDTHEFGVEQNLRQKKIKPQGTGWAGYTCMEAMGGEIFAKTAKTPPLQSGVCGEVVTRYGSARHLRPRGHQWETARRRKPTRCAASLRPPWNGRIGFKPPYSKGGRGKSLYGINLHRGLGWYTLWWRAIIKGLGVEGDDDAARCVATSSEERENRF